MDAYQQVANKLHELGITFDVVEHPPAFTTEQADSYIEGMEGVRTKSMFLTNKKKTQYYLLIMDDKKSLDMDLFKELVSANRIRMASADSLFDQELYHLLVCLTMRRRTSMFISIKRSSTKNA